MREPIELGGTSADAEVVREIARLCEKLRQAGEGFGPGHGAAVRYADFLAEVANHLLDLQEDIYERHLAAYRASLPADLPDDVEFGYDLPPSPC